MSRHLEALAGVGDLSAVDPHDREILVVINSDQNVFAVGGEPGGLGQAADFDVLRFGDLVAVDLLPSEEPAPPLSDVSAILPVPARWP
jgi:hypothetical protein